MFEGARITDAVEYWKLRDELAPAVRLVRNRNPERFRWRKAVANMMVTAGSLDGIKRMRVEEPVREVVLDLSDTDLKREVVLDARKSGVDLDRGEILPHRTAAEVRMIAELTGVRLDLLEKYVSLPKNLNDEVNTGSIVVVARGLAEHFRGRAHRLLLDLPDLDDRHKFHFAHHGIMADRADAYRTQSGQWLTFGRALLGLGELNLLK